MNYFLGLAFVVALFFLCDGTNPLTYSKAYRRCRGGLWAKTSSMVPWVPFAWHYVDPRDTSFEHFDEDYTA